MSTSADPTCKIHEHTQSSATNPPTQLAELSNAHAERTFNMQPQSADIRRLSLVRSTERPNLHNLQAPCAPIRRPNLQSFQICLPSEHVSSHKSADPPPRLSQMPTSTKTCIVCQLAQQRICRGSLQSQPTLARSSTTMIAELANTSTGPACELQQ